MLLLYSTARLASGGLRSSLTYHYTSNVTEAHLFKLAPAHEETKLTILLLIKLNSPTFRPSLLQILQT